MEEVLGGPFDKRFGVIGHGSGRRLVDMGEDRVE